MNRAFTAVLVGITLLMCFQSSLAQKSDNALVIANAKTKQFRHIKMNRWIKIKLKGGNKYHAWFMKGINDSSIVMAHGHVIRFEEINFLREITEMHLVLRFAAPIFFITFGVVLYSVGLKAGKDTKTGRKIATYTFTGLSGLAAITPLIIQPKEYDFNTDWYLSSGTMPKKLFKRALKQPKGDGS